MGAETLTTPEYMAGVVKVTARWETLTDQQQFKVYRLVVGYMSVAYVSYKARSSSVVRTKHEDGHESEMWEAQRVPEWYFSMTFHGRHEFTADSQEDAVRLVTEALGSDDPATWIKERKAAESGDTLPARGIADKPVFGRDTQTNFKKGRRISLEDGRK